MNGADEGGTGGESSADEQPHVRDEDPPHRRKLEQEREREHGSNGAGEGEGEGENQQITVDPSLTGADSAGDSSRHADETHAIDTDPTGGPPGQDPVRDGPSPGANAHRNWFGILVGLSVAAFLTAAVTVLTQDAIEPVLGVTALGVGFAAAAGIARTNTPWLFDVLSAAWVEHRRSVWVATGMFAVGTAIGIALLLAGVNLLEIVAELLEEELLPELEDEQANGELEFTATFFIQNNSVPFLMAIGGALTLGLLTAFIMVFNGIIVGNVSAAAAEIAGVDFILAALVPHGIFELPALFLAAGVGFRLLSRFGQRVLGSRDVFFTRPYLVRTAVFVLFAWLLLVLAAFVEAYVTPELLEVLFAELLEGPEDGPVTP
ncbi:hypothetical protein C482_04551 [Natrialba chahannaoensis JCM 10990]|uniref:Stage II sporulation protein M n=1 Tax=Natrialba chahannaoensis JCM 10990 TaxID=1227492 RepID=M0AW43_9EURY|nr:stage II sporulation protein M [Natrialba chahannaoensis]ELZ02901.1 hypothetical protein C482_04551 [Natrialba chahannaoensis JCM 10990]